MSGALVAGAAQNAHAQTIVHTFEDVSCTAVVGGSPLTQIQDITVGVVAPDTVSPGEVFTLTFPGGSAGLPTRSNGLSITEYGNLFQVVQLNGANFNTGSASSSGPASVVPSTMFASAWSTLTTFAVNKYVYINQAAVPATDPPDWHFYKSLQNSNQNHVPATSPTWWVEVPQSETESWLATQTYAANNFTTDAGIVYKSLLGSNLNHPPASSPTFWSAVTDFTTPNTATLPVANQLQYGQPGPFNPGNAADPASATLTTPDVTVQATAPASGSITLNMVSLTTHIKLNGVLTGDVTCGVPTDTILTIPVVSGPTNLTVDAGPNVSGDVNTPIALSGSFVDPDATPMLTWSVDSPFCSFSDTQIAAPTITCTQAGTFSATLSGTDGINADASDSALVTITGANAPPVVNAGPNVSGFVNDDIDLNGSVVDTDNPDPTILWTVDSPNCFFDDETAPDTVINCDTAGTYAATLTANDGVNAPVSDTAMVTVNAAPPGLHANAGPNVSGNVGSPILLVGSVTDPGFTPTAHWTVDSPTCSFGNANAASTSITCTSSGVFAATLTGHDGTHADSVDTALVTVVAPNSPPNVNAGGNVVGKPNIAIALHGTVVDPDSTPTDHWVSDSPSCTFGNANVADTTITCTTTGVFAATLTAADGVNPPVSSTAIVTVVNNFPPVVNAGGSVSGAVNAAIALHGTVVDPDSSPSVQWATGSPSCSFGNANAADTTITCTAGGVVAATLTANDGVNAPVSDTALVTVNAPNTAPTVSAGPNLTEIVSHNATLVGTVTDPDNTPTLQWATGSPACSFSSPTTATTNFVCSVPGIYAATLTASDGVNLPVSSTALVTFIPGSCTKPCVQIGDATAYEGGAVALPIVLSTPQSSTVTVTATIIPITAGNCRVTPADCDFKTVAVHNITFKANTRFKYLSVTALPDGNVEGGDHTFNVVLSNVSGGASVSIGRGLGTGTIKDATGLGPNKLLIGRSTIPEMDSCATCKATAKLSVVLTATASVSVKYLTVNAGATAGSDYTTKNSTLTFTAGSTTKKFISVVTLGDNDPTESTEGIDVTFSNLTAGFSLVDAPGNIQILDND